MPPFQPFLYTPRYVQGSNPAKFFQQQLANVEQQIAKNTADIIDQRVGNQILYGVLDLTYHCTALAQNPISKDVVALFSTGNQKVYLGTPTGGSAQSLYMRWEKPDTDLDDLPGRSGANVEAKVRLYQLDTNSMSRVYMMPTYTWKFPDPSNDSVSIASALIPNMPLFAIVDLVGEPSWFNERLLLISVDVSF